MTEEEYAEFAQRLAYHMSKPSLSGVINQSKLATPHHNRFPINDERAACRCRKLTEYGRIGGNFETSPTLNEWHSPCPQLAGRGTGGGFDLAALKFEVLQKVGDAVGNIQTYQLQNADYGAVEAHLTFEYDERARKPP